MNDFSPDKDCDISASTYRKLVINFTQMFGTDPCHGKGMGGGVALAGEAIMTVGVVFNQRPHLLTQKVHILHIPGTVFPHHGLENLSDFPVPRGGQLGWSSSPETAVNGKTRVARMIPDAVKISVGVK